MFSLIEHVKALNTERMALFIVARFLALLHVYCKFMALKKSHFLLIKKRNVSPMCADAMFTCQFEFILKYYKELLANNMSGFFVFIPQTHSDLLDIDLSCTASRKLLFNQCLTPSSILSSGSSYSLMWIFFSCMQSSQKSLKTSSQY